MVETETEEADVFDCIYGALYSAGFNEVSRLLTSLKVKRPENGDENKISYWDPGRETRYRARTGKFIRKWFGEGLSDQQICDIGSSINATLWGVHDVRESKGEDVISVYYDLGVSSCMNHEGHKGYLRIYADNPDKVSILHVKMDNGAARCLLWHADDGKSYRSVIYHSADGGQTSVSGLLL